MAFNIRYSIVEHGPVKAGPIGDEALSYSFVIGNVSFEADRKVIGMTWGWVLLLDLAYCLMDISKVLLSDLDANELFEFTESEACLRFSRSGDTISIIPNFSETVMVVELECLVEGIGSFYDRILEDIRRQCPDVLLRPAFDKYLNVR